MLRQNIWKDAMSERYWMYGRLWCWRDWNFFYGKQKEKFQWPKHEDIVWIKSKDVLSIVTVLIPTRRSGRMLKLQAQDRKNLTIYFTEIMKWTLHSSNRRGRHGCDRMVVGFTTTYAISVYQHWCCEFESRSGQKLKYCWKWH
jgi:hypothetical protein